MGDMGLLLLAAVLCLTPFLDVVDQLFAMFCSWFCCFPTCATPRPHLAFLVRLETDVVIADSFDITTAGARDWTANPVIGGQPALSLWSAQSHRQRPNGLGQTTKPGSQALTYSLTLVKGWLSDCQIVTDMFTHVEKSRLILCTICKRNLFFCIPTQREMHK